MKVVSAKWAIAHGIPRSLIEQHHPFGKMHDPKFKVPLCLTHHWKATVGLLREGVSMRFEPNKKKRVAMMVKAEIVLLEQMIESRRRWIKLLEGK